MRKGPAGAGAAGAPGALMPLLGGWLRNFVAVGDGRGERQGGREGGRDPSGAAAEGAWGGGARRLL